MKAVLLPGLLGLGALVGASPAAAQIDDFLGPFTVETLPYEIPSTGRIGGVTVDPYGYVYVANQDERVWKIRPSGELELFVTGLFGSSGGAMLPNGDLLHGSYNSDRIVRVERNGAVHDFVARGLQGPVGMAVVGDAVYAVNGKSDWIAKISMDGEVTEFARDARLRNPNGITADPDGNLYVVNLGNTLVLRISPRGEISEVVTLPGRANAHVAYARGALYVTQIWDNVVLQVEADGSYRVVAGDGTRRAPAGASSAFRTPFPNGIAASSSGSVLYFNTLEGNMIAGEPGVIRVHKLIPPSFNRAFEVAWQRGGGPAVRAKFEAALRLRERPRSQVLPAVYGAARYLLNRGNVAGGLPLVEWAAAEDEDEARGALERGQAHLTWGDADTAVRYLGRAAALLPDNGRVQRLYEAAQRYRTQRSTSPAHPSGHTLDRQPRARGLGYARAGTGAPPRSPATLLATRWWDRPWRRAGPAPMRPSKRRGRVTSLPSGGSLRAPRPIAATPSRDSCSPPSRIGDIETPPSGCAADYRSVSR